MAGLTTKISMADDSKLHVVMFPWLAFGHLIPFLELAKLMASKSHKISFISAPKNIDRLPQIPPTLSPFINFVKIELPKVENLPENAEATRDLPFDKVMYLKIAYDRLRQPVTEFLRAASPDWLFLDFLTYWLCPIAAELGIRTAFFSVVPAAMLGYMGPPEVLKYGDDDRKEPEDILKPPRWVPFESKLGMAYFHLQRVLANFKDEGENVGDVFRLGSTIEGCDAVVVRTSPEFEPEWLKLVEEIYKKPVIPSGFLPTQAPAEVDSGDESWRETKDWLDKQRKGTVVYIAFGTETKPSQYELTQLALGLEISELPFYWVLIKQRGSSDDEVLELPDGFEERTRGRGILCTGWAPQLKIVSHDSVGAMLIHSGMSSVVEGFQFGRALILIPFLFDQALIASYLVEKKAAYMIPRNELDGSFTPESVAESLSLVIYKEEGKMYRDKAKELRTLFGDKDKQDKCINNVLSYFENHKINKRISGD